MIINENGLPGDSLVGDGVLHGGDVGGSEDESLTLDEGGDLAAERGEDGGVALRRSLEHLERNQLGAASLVVVVRVH